jgi:hypothetical protein
VVELSKFQQAMFAKCSRSLGFITQGFTFEHARGCVTEFRHGPLLASKTTSTRLYGYAAKMINVARRRSLNLSIEDPRIIPASNDVKMLFCLSCNAFPELIGEHTTVHYEISGAKMWTVGGSKVQATRMRVSAQWRLNDGADLRYGFHLITPHGQNVR